MKELSKYKELNEMVNTTLNILDEDFQVPESLTDRIMSSRPQSQQPKIRKLNFAFYAQVAAVLAAGIFLGIVLGENANTDILLTKESKMQRSLIEYKISHHLYVDHTQSYNFQ